MNRQAPSNASMLTCPGPLVSLSLSLSLFPSLPLSLSLPSSYSLSLSLPPPFCNMHVHDLACFFLPSFLSLHITPLHHYNIYIYICMIVHVHDLACFFLPSFLSLIKTYIYIYISNKQTRIRKKQAKSNKQQGKVTQHTQGSHFS